MDKMAKYAGLIYTAFCLLHVRISKEPQFLINLNPAVFHAPWFRDADAVHLVSRCDIEMWHRKNGFSVRRCYPPFRNIQDFILKRIITLGLVCHKA